MATTPPPSPTSTETFLFGSESVTEGHPDKLCDIISDSILDACLLQDPDSQVAVETCAKGPMIFVAGEVISKSTINYDQVVRDTLRSIGYDSTEKVIYSVCIQFFRQTAQALTLPRLEPRRNRGLTIARQRSSFQLITKLTV